ncbi:MAG: DNA polymerase IV [Candidatus Micrarchaeota archaeon]|nr:DNA polymerase IV [Candidatus Micrarchaeota archaeon]MDE1834697.1 DNA polymerase IV [Candidatus Micrarchaeota archaeon]MDE1859722.1 DNA polymerase IV [Candidatus Micrarchaeota archaeon]
MRIIMLIDMDYFYVACEELRHPEIKGKPSIVGADPKGGAGRGVVMTCNYKAREFGIRSGMPISVAYKAKPDAVFLPVDFDYYDEISKKVMEVIKVFAGKFEQVSVDEAFIDASSKVPDYEDAEAYAKKIQDEVLSKAGIKSSIGIGPNKLIAKMACEKAKPNGIKLVTDAQSRRFLAEMDVGKMYGIGGKTSEKLKKLGYNTIGELAKANPMRLIDQFGAFGPEMVKNANGIDDSDVIENYEVKSIGRELTFEQNTDDDRVVEKAIEKLSADVIADASKNQKSFKTITLKLRYGDFTEHLHSRSVRATNELNTIIQTAKELYRQSVDKSKKVRKIGVRVSNLISNKGQKKISLD